MVDSNRLVVFAIGTRAQLIKLAPVVAACERDGMDVTLLMTGQHEETMQDLVDEFGIISPQVRALPAAEHSSVRSLLRWVPSAYAGIKARLRELPKVGEEIDVIVHGDTLSTVLGAIAGRNHGARVIHIESGLSSGRVLDPFPEELCRRIVFRFADIAMCPDAEATKNMRRYRRCKVFNTGGNTIVDAVALSGASPVDRDPAQPYLVASLHRFQNIYDSRRLHALVGLLEAAASRYPIHFVLHPATRSRLCKEGLMDRLAASPNIQLIPRLGYRDFLRLAAHAACVLTDGGSNQEELATLGVPTIVMRDTTERRDGLGTNAMMESDVPGDVLGFILSGGFEELRREPGLASGSSPSQFVCEFLSGRRPDAH